MKPVDVLASEKTRRELRILMPAFQVLDPATRGKAIITAAWTFVRSGDIEEVLQLVDLLTPVYVQELLPAQMDQDPCFNKMAEAVANALVEAQVHVPEYTAPTGAYVAKSGLA
jgi:hypothetical protein